MKTFLWSFLLFTCYSCSQTPAFQNQGLEFAQVAIDQCDDPDANISCCFISMPAKLTPEVNIAGKNEKGERLIISGIIYEKDGKTPSANSILYAYHTDNAGYYSKTGNETGIQKWHGRLHGWCRADASGYYEINTIRPARYPNNTIPAHIHAAIKTSDGRIQWIDDFVFKDDDLINQEYIRRYGTDGIVNIQKDNNKTWIGKRNITLEK